MSYEEKFRLKEGINFCTNEEYHGDKGRLSSSNYKLLLKNPADFYEECILGKRREVSKSLQNVFDEGSYAHALILEPEVIAEEFAFFEGWRKAGKDWTAFKEDEANASKIIMSKPQKVRVEGWVENYKKRDVAVELVSGGFAEYSVAGDFLGIPSKARADYINIDKGYIADVKTTAYDTDVESFRGTMNDLSYDLSAALYTKLFADHYGKPFDFYFIVLGKKSGTCEVFKMSEETLAIGMDKLKKAASLHKYCIEKSSWTNTRKRDTIISNDGYKIKEI